MITYRVIQNDKGLFNVIFNEKALLTDFRTNQEANRFIDIMYSIINNMRDDGWLSP